MPTRRSRSRSNSRTRSSSRSNSQRRTKSATRKQQQQIVVRPNSVVANVSGQQVYLSQGYIYNLLTKSLITFPPNNSKKLCTLNSVLPSVLQYNNQKIFTPCMSLLFKNSQYNSVLGSKSVNQSFTAKISISVSGVQQVVHTKTLLEALDDFITAAEELKNLLEPAGTITINDPFSIPVITVNMSKQKKPSFTDKNITSNPFAQFISQEVNVDATEDVE